MKRKMKCSRCGESEVLGKREDLPICDRCAYALGVESRRAELEARIEDRDFWHEQAAVAQRDLSEARRERDDALRFVRVKAKANARWRRLLRSHIREIAAQADVDLARAEAAEAALAESDAAFRALKDSIGRADSERVELRRHVESAERKVLDLEHNLAHEEERAHVAEATLQRVQATVEAEKHYTDECGWDVPVIRVLAALRGEEKTP